MVRMKRVVFTTDFSETANHALPYAIKMAKIFGAELVMLHVVTLYEHDPNEPAHRFPSLDKYCKEVQEYAERGLDICIDRVGDAGVRVRKAIVRGTTSHAGIVDFAKEQGEGTMIVMSTHGRGGISHVLLGSVTENVIRYAPCPVLVVRRPEHEFLDKRKGQVKIKKILLAVDFSKGSLKPVELVRFIARKHKSQVLVFHAIDVDIPPIYYTAGIDSVLQLDPDLPKRMEKKMRDFVGARLSGLNVRYEIGDGKAVNLIREFAKKENVDLVAISASGSHRIGEFILGSTAARVVQKAVCPVLVV